MVCPTRKWAHPNTANHPKDLAVDVATNPDTLRWLRTHGPSHGWWPIASEEWHWEYRGASYVQILSLDLGVGTNERD